MSDIILYYIILYYSILYYIILYDIILYYIYTYIYIHTTLDYTLSHGKFCEMAIPSIKHGMLKDVAPTSSHVPPAAVTRASNLLRSMAFSYVEHQGRIIPVGWVNRIFKNRLSQPSLHWDCLKKLFLTPQTLCCLLMVFWCSFSMSILHFWPTPHPSEWRPWVACFETYTRYFRSKGPCSASEVTSARL